MSETTESLIAYCQENRRVCPVPQQWDKLWKGLPNRTRKDGQWQPPPPAEWPGFPTPGMVKMISLAEHIQWAAEHGELESVAVFLRGLCEDEWFHLGD